MLLPKIYNILKTYKYLSCIVLISTIIAVTFISENFTSVFCIIAMIAFFFNSIFLFLNNNKKYYFFNILSYKELRVSYIVCFIFAVFTWIGLSYYSYYDGIASAVLKDNTFFIKKAEIIFNNENSSFEENINLYKIYTDSAISGITLTDLNNHSIYKIKDPVFRGDGNQYTLKTDNKNSKIIKTKDGDLKFEFKYSISPKWYIGLIRSITCSLSDLFITGDQEYKKKDLLHRVDKLIYDYFVKRNYKRSKNLYRPFVLYLMLYLIIFVLYKRQKEFRLKLKSRNNKLKIKNIELKNTSAKLKISNKNLIETNAKLEEFKIIHSKMYSDLLNEINNLKQDMQEFTFSWDYYMEQAFKTERHDLMNIRDAKFNEFLNTVSKEEHKIISQYIYDEYVKKMIEIIIENMRKLPDIVKYDLEKVQIDDVVKSIENGIPKYKDFKINLTKDKFKYEENEYCNINRHRLSSIVFNICANAKRQTVEKAKEFGFKGKRALYIPYINVNVEKIFIDENQYIQVSIKDNAGGFRDEILNKIYKEPVCSTKTYLDQKEKEGKQRKGEGSIYVAFFAKYMKCKIKAYNYKLSEKDVVEKGAAVDLLIPVMIDKKNNKED